MSTTNMASLELMVLLVFITWFEFAVAEYRKNRSVGVSLVLVAIVIPQLLVISVFAGEPYIRDAPWLEEVIRYGWIPLTLSTALFAVVRGVMLVGRGKRLPGAVLISSGLLELYLLVTVIMLFLQFTQKGIQW